MAGRETYFEDLSKELRREWFKNFERTSENGKQMVKIPYVIDQSMGNERETIRQAMDTIHYYSRVRFVPRETEICYLTITKKNGCFYSGFGNSPCLATISLGEGCKNYGIVLHELLHALGFEHEHQRPDRDEFVVISEENIRTGHRQFEKIPPEKYRWHDFNFDYKSIMLYDSYTFSIGPGFPTIMKKNMEIIDRNSYLSEDDKRKLRSLDEQAMDDGVSMIEEENSCKCS